jgi:RNA polymerase sigma factor (TIGR02999 family)
MGAAAAALQGGVAIAAPPREPLASDVRMPRLALVHGRDDDSVTRIIAACAGDDGALLSRVFPVVYEELRRIAHRALLRARGSATLSTTALVNETYLKLAGHADLDLEGRKHLFALCARAMRQIVVDHARRRHADKRGGEPAWSLDTLDADSADRPETVVARDEALTAHAERHTRRVTGIEYSGFGGRDTPGIAEHHGLSPRSVQREWLRARAWVGRALDVRGDAESAA